MSDCRIYRVGDHLFAITCQNSILSEKELEPYAPFQTDSYCRIVQEDTSQDVMSRIENTDLGTTEGNEYTETEKGNRDFETTERDLEERLFTLTVIEYTDSYLRDNDTVRGDTSATSEIVIAELKDENGEMTICMQEDGSMTVYLATPDGRECCRLHISKDYREARAWIGGTPGERRYALDTALMLLYTFASSQRDTLMAHASAVEYLPTSNIDSDAEDETDSKYTDMERVLVEGRGYLFLGKSGTGKSTHSQLWLDNISGTTLLNDDNPILRIINGRVYVYGSPWSGKTWCYRNRRVPVGGIVRLHQATHNEIIPLRGLKAYAALLPSCSCMKWNHDMAEGIHSTISKVIESVSLYRLDCLPNKEAALLCFETLTKKEKRVPKVEEMREEQEEKRVLKIATKREHQEEKKALRVEAKRGHQEEDFEEERREGVAYE